MSSGSSVAEEVDDFGVSRSPSSPHAGLRAPTVTATTSGGATATARYTGVPRVTSPESMDYEDDFEVSRSSPASPPRAGFHAPTDAVLATRPMRRGMTEAAVGVGVPRRVASPAQAQALSPRGTSIRQQSSLQSSPSLWVRAAAESFEWQSGDDDDVEEDNSGGGDDGIGGGDGGGGGGGGGNGGDGSRDGNGGIGGDGSGDGSGSGRDGSGDGNYSAESFECAWESGDDDAASISVGGGDGSNGSGGGDGGSNGGGGRVVKSSP